MNRYEKEIIGYYKVGEHTWADSLSTVSGDLPHLILNDNKTFSLAFKDTAVKGSWKADDYGDFTLIEFQAGERQSQGKIIGTEIEPEIEISIPSNFYCPFLKTLIFKRVQEK